jgi:hypothetical protein
VPDQRADDAGGGTSTEDEPEPRGHVREREAGDATDRERATAVGDDIPATHEAE